MAEQNVAEAPAGGALTLHQAATLVGAYRWIEERLFALTGRWSGQAAMTPPTQVLLFEASRQHGWHAELWAARLPLVAGIDAGALIRPAGPTLAPLLAALEGETSPARRLAGLHRVVLPRLATTYRRHLDRVVPVADRPVARVLRLVLADLDDQRAAGAAVLGELLDTPEGARAAAGPGPLDEVVGRSGDDGCLVPWPQASPVATPQPHPSTRPHPSV